MVEKLRTVGIGEMIASNGVDDVLVAYGLGSCVVVCMYDPSARVGGMLHALLPIAPTGEGTHYNPHKYVDSGVALLVTALLELGAARSRLRAVLCGGAEMLTAPVPDDSFCIGGRNLSSAETALERVGVGIYERVTGGRSGRTVRLYMRDGRVAVRSPCRESAGCDPLGEETVDRVAARCLS
jgi:chemotaxis protein CheD